MSRIFHIFFSLYMLSIQLMFIEHLLGTKAGMVLWGEQSQQRPQPIVISVMDTASGSHRGHRCSGGVESPTGRKTWRMDGKLQLGTPGCVGEPRGPALRNRRTANRRARGPAGLHADQPGLHADQRRRFLAELQSPLSLFPASAWEA